MPALNEYPMPPLRPEVERDGYGRYLLPNPEEPGRNKSYTRTTTLSKAISDTYNLDQWGKRMVVQGLAIEPTLLDTIDLTQDDRSLRDDLTRVQEAATEASGAHVARERGTQLHYMTEAVDGGHLALDDVPGEYIREVRAYREAMAKAGITIVPEMIERILLNVTANVAGTADRQHVIMPNGKRLVADVKTGRDLSYGWPEICMQLAIYNHADAMLAYADDGTPYWDGVPEVEQNVALVMHVPVDQAKCTLWLVDTAAGWAAVELAHEVRAYRSRRNLAVFLDAKAWGAGDPAPAVVEGTVVPDAPADVFPGMSVETAAEAADVPDDPTFTAARDAYAATVEEIETLKGTWTKGKRRTKAMIEADNYRDAMAADNEGSFTAEQYGLVTRKLRRGYKLDEVPTTAPPPKGPERNELSATELDEADEADEAAASTNAPVFGDAPVDVEGNPSTDGPGVPLSDTPVTPEVRTKYGTLVTKGAPRPIECTEAIDHADPTSEAMAAVYAEYADVWEQFHTDRAQARVDAAQTEAAQAAEAGANTEETDPATARLWAIAGQLDKCTTAEEMGAVYEANADVWTEEMTAYGQARLAENNA